MCVCVCVCVCVCERERERERERETYCLPDTVLSSGAIVSIGNKTIDFHELMEHRVQTWWVLQGTGS